MHRQRSQLVTSSNTTQHNTTQHDTTHQREVRSIQTCAGLGADQPTSSLLEGHCARVAATAHGSRVVLLDREDTQASAAVAFKHMCDGTSRHLIDEPHSVTSDSTTASTSATSTQPASSTSSFLPSLLAVYKASSTLRLSDQRDIIEGMCSVVSVLDQPRLNHYLQPMLHTIVQALQQALATGSTGGSSGGSKAPAALYDGLDRLAALFSHLEPHRNDQPECVRLAIMHCTQHCWPVMEAITAQYGGDERCMEKVCRCWRYAMKKTGDRHSNHFKAALPLMLQSVQLQYKRHHTA